MDSPIGCGTEPPRSSLSIPIGVLDSSSGADERLLTQGRGVPAGPPRSPGGRSPDPHLLDAHRAVLALRPRAGLGDPVGLQPVGNSARRGPLTPDNLQERLELRTERGLEAVHEESV